MGRGGVKFRGSGGVGVLLWWAGLSPEAHSELGVGGGVRSLERHQPGRRVGVGLWGRMCVFQGVRVYLRPRPVREAHWGVFSRFLESTCPSHFVFTRTELKD